MEYTTGKMNVNVELKDGTILKTTGHVDAINIPNTQLFSTKITFNDVGKKRVFANNNPKTLKDIEVDFNDLADKGVVKLFQPALGR